MFVKSILSAATCLAITVACFSQDNKLKVGDAAPGLDIEKWAKGSETTLEQGTPYVVEFWATWCAPCRKSIPHLTELQHKYKDKGLVVIGISDEEPAPVEKFVRLQGSKMDYIVAVDRRGSTKRAWHQAAGLQGIPAAFIVDQRGKIAWIGNPHPQANEGFEQTLAKVMSGRFDAKLEKQAAPVLSAARSARKVRNWRLASRHYDEVVALDAPIFIDVALEKFDMLLRDMDDREGAYNYASREMIDRLYANDAGALQMLAERIVLDPKIDPEKRDFDVALQAAEAALRVAENRNNDPQALATVALVRFHRGEVDQAIELQKQAYFVALPRDKPELRRTLSTYQLAQQRSALQKKN